MPPREWPGKSPCQAMKKIAHMHLARAGLCGVFILVLLRLPIALAFAIPPSYTEAPAARQVLLLNSHHKGLSWTDQITSAVEDSFKANQAVQIIIEYMDTKRLPPDSRIANRPSSAYHQYKYAVWTICGVIVSMSMLIILLFFNIIKRHLAEKRLQKYQAHLQDLVDQKTKSLRNAVGTLEKEISRRKQAEERLQEVLAEWRESNQELEQFAYIASHDLQEPLRTVGSFARLLAKRYKGQLDQDADEFIDFITDAATRGQAMVNNLLEYSRIERRGKNFEQVDTNEIVQNVLDNLNYAIAESNAEIHRAQDLPKISADPEQIARVFQNLISNAVNFCKHDSPLKISITAARDGDNWRFTVSDNGIGIASEHYEKIFAPFQSLRQSHGQSTGMGLAICKKIIERHGGEIWVESTPGKGSDFHFTLPA